MPHLIKKIRNQLETSSGRSKARACQFPSLASDGETILSGLMNLKLLEDVWLANERPAGDSTPAAALRVAWK